MPEIKVKLEKETKSGVSKKTGKAYSMDIIALILPNGGKIEVISNRYNYRTFDYLVEQAGVTVKK